MSSFITTKPKTEPFILGLFDQASESLAKIDLSFINVRFYHTEDPEFKNYIESISSKSAADRNFDVFYDMTHNGSTGYHSNLWVATPINQDKGLVEDILFKIRDILLIMFPSDFHLKHIINLDGEHQDRQVTHWTSWDENSHWWIDSPDDAESMDKYVLKFDERYILIVNTFFKLAWERIESLKYLKLCIRSYVESFAQNFLTMRIVNFSIALESLQDAQTEISYRIARSSAVINGIDKERGRTLFVNAKKLYGVRSLIVHGKEPSGLTKIYFHFQALVSRTIIELIQQNIPSRAALEIAIDSHGFGDKTKLSSDYKDYFFNPATRELIYEIVIVPKSKSDKGEKNK